MDREAYREAFEYFKKSFSCYDCGERPFKYFVFVGGRRYNVCKECVKDFMEARKIDKNIKIYRAKRRAVR